MSQIPSALQTAIPAIAIVGGSGFLFARNDGEPVKGAGAFSVDHAWYERLTDSASTVSEDI